MYWHKLTGITVLIYLLSGCSNAQYYQYSNNLEQPSGPGLFSGPDGKFSITRESE